MEKIINILKKEKKNIIISILTAMLISSVFTTAFAVKLYADSVQSSIAQKVVRLHIVANSDSDTDQNLKLKVRDSVIEFMGDKFNNCKSREESINIIKLNIDAIKQTAEKTLQSENCYYNVDVSFERTLFPVKNYEDITLPAGYYDALNIKIGESKGHNWWCVMYPSLCIYNNGEEFIQEEELKNILTSEEYSIITGCDKINIKFATVELVKEIESYFE